jgi:hypothetical protein
VFSENGAPVTMGFSFVKVKLSKFELVFWDTAQDLDGPMIRDF